MGFLLYVRSQFIDYVETTYATLIIPYNFPSEPSMLKLFGNDYFHGTRGKAVTIVKVFSAL